MTNTEIREAAKSAKFIFGRLRKKSGSMTEIFPENCAESCHRQKKSGFSRLLQKYKKKTPPAKTDQSQRTTCGKQ